MHPHEYLPIIGEWETQFPVDSWTIGGIHVWPIIRLQLAARLLRSGVETGSAGKGGRLFGMVAPFAQLVQDGRALAHALVVDRARTTRTLHGQDAVFLSMGVNRSLVGGRWFDRHCDPIADILIEQGRGVLALEHAPVPATYRIPRHRESLYIQPALWRAAVRARLAEHPRLRQKCHLPQYDQFVRAVAEGQMGIEPLTFSELRQRVNRINIIADYFERLFHIAQPRVAFVVCYYGTTGMAYVLAARRCGVPVVDIQHGAVRMHRAYVGWRKVPQEGYNLLPNVFWCWSALEAEAIRGMQTAPMPHRPLVGGHPWNGFWSQDAHPLVARHSRQIADLRRRQPAARHILLTLAWDRGFTPQLQEIVARSPRDWFWWVRLHPLMDNERDRIKSCLRQAVGDRAEVDVASDLPLPLLLQHSDVHVTRFSAVVLEASMYGVPSVVVDPVACDLFGEEIAAGAASFAEDTHEVLAQITSYCGPKQQRPHQGAEHRIRLQAALQELLPESGRTGHSARNAA